MKAPPPSPSPSPPPEDASRAAARADVDVDATSNALAHDADALALVQCADAVLGQAIRLLSGSHRHDEGAAPAEAAGSFASNRADDDAAPPLPPPPSHGNAAAAVVVVGDAEMRFESRLIPGSSAGKHLRHVHDHFRVLLDALDVALAHGAAAAPPTHPAPHRHGDDDAAAAADTGAPPPQPTPPPRPATTAPASGGAPVVVRLDYDKRHRAPRMETSASFALAQFLRTRARLHDGVRRAARRNASCDDGASGAGAAPSVLDLPVELEATTPAQLVFRSTFGRELWFVSLHAIHHLALCRPILTHELGLAGAVDDEFGVAPSTIVLRRWAAQGSPQPQPQPPPPPGSRPPPSSRHHDRAGQGARAQGETDETALVGRMVAGARRARL